MITLESIKAYAAGQFSQLNADTTVVRDPNTGKFGLACHSRSFEISGEIVISESDLNAVMEANVRALRDSFVHAVLSGAYPFREVAPDAEPVISFDGAPDPAPEPSPAPAVPVEPAPSAPPEAPAVPVISAPPAAPSAVDSPPAEPEAKPDPSTPS